MKFAHVVQKTAWLMTLAIAGALPCRAQTELPSAPSEPPQRLIRMEQPAIRERIFYPPRSLFAIYEPRYKPRGESRRFIPNLLRGMYGPYQKPPATRYRLKVCLYGGNFWNEQY